MRLLLGVAGSPGAGKSLAAASLAAAITRRSPATPAIAVPMDGFHLAQAELRRLGREDRKGAPDTFDSAGFVALLRRLAEPDCAEDIYAPAFDRRLEEPIAGSIRIRPDHRIVIVEGNYLLLDENGFAGVRPLLDAVWFLAPPEPERVSRLVARHMAHGRSAEEARQWVRAVDGPNATLVVLDAYRSDLIIAWGTGGEPTARVGSGAGLDTAGAGTDAAAVGPGAVDVAPAASPHPGPRPAHARTTL